MTGSSTTTDIAIVGGGIAGLSLAAALGSRARVTVLEAEPELFRHTSSRSAEQMQPTYGPAPVRALTTASIPLVEQIGAELGGSIFTPRPLLWLAYTDDPARFAGVLAEIPSLVDIGPDAAVALLPALRREPLVAAAIDQAAVEVDVPRLLDWYRETALAAGVTILTDAPLTQAALVGSSWQLDAGEYRLSAGILVDAAGAWADQVAKLASVAPRGLVPTRRTVAVVLPTGRAIDPAWPMASDLDDTFYFRPRGAEILASGQEDEPTAPEDARPRADTVDEILRRINAATDLKLTTPSRTWTGLRTLSADSAPVVGFDDTVPGFFWLAGQGGYGIQTSAALGRVAAAALLGEPIPLGLDAVPAQLAPARAMVPRAH